MLGAIIGDWAGSTFEHANTPDRRVTLGATGSRFTDDTVLTVAVAEALATGADLAALFRTYYRRYGARGYGGRYRVWAETPDAGPYQSFGNGAAMRVSPVAWAHDTLDQVLAAAERVTVVTHDHPEGVRGAQAIASAIFFAREGRDKASIRREVETRFGYDLSRSYDDRYTDNWQKDRRARFDVTCQGTIPEALAAFFAARDFEESVQLAIALGGDSDTNACIAGSVAEAFYGGVPEGLATRVWTALCADDVRLADIVRDVAGKRYPCFSTQS